jgi:cytochrome c oxidase subunit 2
VSTVSYPSIGLEYGISPDITPLVTLKIIAHQWYWVFELEAKASPGLIEGNDNFFFFNSDIYKLFTETYGDVDAFYNELENLDFQTLSKTIEVNLKNEEEPGFFRLLTVDNKIVLPINTPIKLIVTSVDVLHSFAIPGWGVKIDAIPGRLSEQIILIERPGIYWGQCSELCGPYHGFMPVVIEISSYPVFLKNFFN